MNKEVPLAGFRTGCTYPAIVENIQNDRVFFKIARYDDMKKVRSATYYVHGGNMNLFQIFHRGQRTTVKMEGFCRNGEIIVTPELLPIDQFFIDNPLNSRVIGVITALTSFTMLVMLEKNVFAITKRSKHAKTGRVVICKIRDYNPNKKKLSILAIE